MTHQLENNASMVVPHMVAIQNPAEREIVLELLSRTLGQALVESQRCVESFATSSFSQKSKAAAALPTGQAAYSDREGGGGGGGGSGGGGQATLGGFFRRAADEKGSGSGRKGAGGAPGSAGGGGNRGAGGGGSGSGGAGFRRTFR